MATSGKRIKKTEKTEKTTVTEIDYLNNEAAETQAQQKKNSIFVEFGDNPIKIAILGAAMRVARFARHKDDGEVEDVTDMMLDIMCSVEGEEDKLRTFAIRSFDRRSLAWRDITQILKDAGLKITHLGDETARPNFRDYKWNEINPEKIPIVVVKTRQYNNRWWPNRIYTYKPPVIQVAESGNLLDDPSPAADAAGE